MAAASEVRVESASYCLGELHAPAGVGISARDVCRDGRLVGCADRVSSSELATFPYADRGYPLSGDDA